MKNKSEYFAPRVRVVETCPEQTVCSNPTAGGNEDVGYEDWGI